MKHFAGAFNEGPLLNAAKFLSYFSDRLWNNIITQFLNTHWAIINWKANSGGRIEAIVF